MVAFSYIIYVGAFFFFNLENKFTIYFDKKIIIKVIDQNLTS